MTQRARYLTLTAIAVAGIIVTFVWMHIDLARLHARVYNDGLGSDERVAAVHGIAMFSNSYATRLLLEIAFNDTAYYQSRAEAISALGERSQNGDEIADRLSTLLQPHQGLVIRRAAARALSRMPCSARCAASILHYMERDWRGDMFSEDRFENPGDSERLLGTEKKEVLSILSRCLSDNRDNTLSVLRGTYGIGSGNPSAFGLHMVELLDLKEACPELAVPIPSTQADSTIREKLSEIRKRVCNSRE
jgi:hypothetical protein